MSEQDNGQLSTLQRPTTNNQGEWKAYWKQQGQPRRTEPEIGEGRQRYLNERRQSSADSPFKDIGLSRADVEWLLATHENESKHTSSDKNRWERKRLDL